MSNGRKPSHSAVPNRLIRFERCRLPVKPISCCELGRHEGLALRKILPSVFNRPFGRFMYFRLVEHYVRTSDDLSVLGVLESVSDLSFGDIQTGTPTQYESEIRSIVL